MHEHRYDERIETLRPAASRIDQDVSAGTLNTKVQEDAASTRMIDVTLAAGTATLRPGR